MTSTYQRSIDVGACKLAIPIAVLRKILEPRCVSAHNTGSGGVARRACGPARKSAGGRLEILALPSTAQRLHQQYTGVHSSDLDAHTRELRLERGIFIRRNLEIRDQSRLVAILRLLQGLGGRRHGRRLTDAFLLQLA